MTRIRATNETQRHRPQCEDLPRILKGDLLGQWLDATQTSLELIRAGVPAGWRIGDKTGRSCSGALNDVAIVYPPDASRFSLRFTSSIRRARMNKD
jgi:beta-lactamase class A